MIEVKISDLIGPALDWAVAQVPGALDLIVEIAKYDEPFCFDSSDKSYWLAEPTDGYTVLFRPSTDWAQGGPLIEHHKACLAVCQDGDWCCAFEPGERLEDWGDKGYGSTPLIAACRAIVADKIGDTVMIPKELMQ